MENLSCFYFVDFSLFLLSSVCFFIASIETIGDRRDSI